MRRRSVLRWVARVAVVVGAVVLMLAPTLDYGALLATLAALVIALVLGLVSISRRDPVAVLTLMVAGLYLIPADQVLVGPLGTFGNPAQMLALGALVLWASGRALGLIRGQRGHPVRWAMLFYLIAVLTAYAAAGLRLLTADEAASTTRWVLIALSLIGIVMLTTDGIDSAERLEDLLVRVVLFAGLAAVLGALEYLDGGFRWATVFHVPGLVGAEIPQDTRGGFVRVVAAASHPIEYAVVMGALAPMALHLALHARNLAARKWCRVALALIIFVTPLSVSRSGLVSLAVGLGFYFFALSPRGRLNLATVAVFVLAAFQVAVPGLISTFRYFFTAGDNDASVAGRTDDYARIPGYLHGHLIFGRGLGTFIPTQYFFLDNQYLLTLLNDGLVGLVALGTVIVTGICAARGARHRTDLPAVRGLAQALAGTIAAIAAALALFDGLAFRQLAFTLFLMVGCAGALWGAVRSSPRRFPDGRLRLDREDVPVRELEGSIR